MNNILMVFQNATSWLIVLCAFGVAGFFRDFAKIKLGPLFTLELFSLIWFVVFLPKLYSLRRELFHKFRWPLAFVAYCGLLLVFDIISPHAEPISSFRLAQHAAIFVYPALWLVIGYVLAKKPHQEKSRVLIIGSSVVAALSFLIRFTYLGHLRESALIPDMAVGPIAAVFLSFYGAQVWKGSKHRVSTVVWGLICFVPFWFMWAYLMQRTALVLLAFLLVAAPIVQNRSAWSRNLKTIAASFLVLVLGFVAVTVSKSSSVSLEAGLHQSALHSLQHGEDYDPYDPSKKFQLRFRGFLWKTAVSDWLEKPVFGHRFIPEIPSAISPWDKNDGHYDLTHNPQFKSFNNQPVIGPHNSYLAILARTGLVGAVLFLIFLANALWRIRGLVFKGSSLSLFETLLVFIPVNGLIYALFNVGFESGYACFLLWLSLGMIYGLAPER